ncbi:MAG: hypothetical protein LBM87_05495 [Ruminococcus sp.]|jgi:hypothetical protein|nr:hypothetical protein [Ruminococcus sp.]
MKKKLISLLFALILTVGVFPGVTAGAENSADFILPFYTKQLSERQLEEYIDIRNAVLNGKSSYTFSETIRTQAEANKIIANAQIYLQLLLFYDTYTFNLEDFTQVNVNSGGGQQLKLKFDYYYTQKSFKTIITRLNEAWDEVSEALADMTGDVAKIKYIHDYIAEKADYDLNSKNNDLAYGALYLGKAKCDGYAYAFQYLAEKAGYEVTVALDDGTESEPGHAWNKIKVGKSWYNIDITNNDYTDDTGFVFYDYFMLADSEYKAADEWDDPYIKEVKAANKKNSYHEMYKLTADTAEEALAAINAVVKTKKNSDSKYLVTYQLTSKEEFKRLEDFFTNKKSELRKSLGVSNSADLEWYFADDVLNVNLIVSN